MYQNVKEDCSMYLYINKTPCKFIFYAYFWRSPGYFWGMDLQTLSMKTVERGGKKSHCFQEATISKYSLYLQRQTSFVSGFFCCCCCYLLQHANAILYDQWSKKLILFHVDGHSSLGIRKLFWIWRFLLNYCHTSQGCLVSTVVTTSCLCPIQNGLLIEPQFEKNNNEANKRTVNYFHN